MSVLPSLPPSFPPSSNPTPGWYMHPNPNPIRTEPPILPPITERVPLVTWQRIAWLIRKAEDEDGEEGLSGERTVWGMTKLPGTLRTGAKAEVFEHLQYPLHVSLEKFRRVCGDKWDDVIQSVWKIRIVFTRGPVTASPTSLAKLFTELQEVYCPGVVLPWVFPPYPAGQRIRIMNTPSVDGHFLVRMATLPHLHTLNVSCEMAAITHIRNAISPPPGSTEPPVGIAKFFAIPPPPPLVLPSTSLTHIFIVITPPQSNSGTYLNVPSILGALAMFAPNLVHLDASLGASAVGLSLTQALEAIAGGEKPMARLERVKIKSGKGVWSLEEAVAARAKWVKGLGEFKEEELKTEYRKRIPTLRSFRFQQSWYRSATGNRFSPTWEFSVSPLPPPGAPDAPPSPASDESDVEDGTDGTDEDGW